MHRCWQGYRFVSRLESGVRLWGCQFRFSVKGASNYAAYQRNFPNMSPLLENSAALPRIAAPSSRRRHRGPHNAYRPDECPNTLRNTRSTCRSRRLFRFIGSKVRGYRLGVLLKPFVGKDIGIREGGDDDVQRFAAVWRLVLNVLRPKEGRRRLTLFTSLERGLTSRNLPPLIRGSNQPRYSDEGSPVRIVCVSPVVGYAAARTRVGSSKENSLSIFLKSKIRKK